MKKLVVPAAVLAGLLMTSSLAWGQETGPDTEACQTATRLVETALAERDAAKIPSQQEQDVTDAQAVLDAATDAATADGTGLTEGDLNQEKIEQLRRDFGEENPVAKEQIRLIGEVLSARHALKAQQDELSGLQATLAEKQDALDGAEEERDGSCAPPTTEEPPAPPVEDDDTPGLNPEYDCRDFPLIDGTTAQDILNADGNDPHKLDLDSDGVACETSENHAGRDSDGDGVIDNRGVVEEDSLDDTSTGTSGNVVVPNGVIDTGVGPA